MQFRELASTELDEAFPLLLSLRPDLSAEQFAVFINTHSPYTYRPLGAFERGRLSLYAGVSIHENLELGRYLLIDDFVAPEKDSHSVSEMIEFLGDYARMHQCHAVVLWGNQMGITLRDLEGFRPKRDGFVKFV